jgi:hypothetical protein
MKSIFQRKDGIGRRIEVALYWEGWQNGIAGLDGAVRDFRLISNHAASPEEAVVRGCSPQFPALSFPIEAVITLFSGSTNDSCQK